MFFPRTSNIYYNINILFLEYLIDSLRQSVGLTDKKKKIGLNRYAARMCWTNNDNGHPVPFRIAATSYIFNLTS